MRSPITRLVPLVAVLAGAPLAFAETVTPALTPPTSATSTPTSATSPTAVPSPSTSAGGSPTSAPSPRPTILRPTPRPTATPDEASEVEPTPAAIPGARGEEGAAPEPPVAGAIPTAPPVAAVRAFRTPEREAEPAFVAPQVAPPSAAEGEPDAAAAEPMPSPDQPYTATVTFRAVASAEVDGFELVVIYPRSAGDFVGSGDRVDCRKTGDATLFADDNDAGMLRLLVASRTHALTFPFDIVCHFTVEPNAILTARLIAVNVAEVTSASAPADASALTVTILAH